MFLDKLRWISTDPLEGFVAMINATFDQRAYRFRNDDGSETSATWKAAQNTAISQTIGELFRLRIAVQETAGGGANNQTIVLQSNINGQGWFDVGPSSNGVRLGQSMHVPGQTPTTRQLTGTTGTFRPGVVLAEVSGTNISFSGSDHTEVEWSSLLITGEVPVGVTVQFRVTINGSVANTVTANPSVTAAAPPAPTTAPVLSSPAKTSDSIDLAWTTVTGNYELQRNGVTIYNGPNTSFTDGVVPPLDPETTYQYRVRATNEGGEGPWSNVLSVTTEAAPQTLKASDLVDNFAGTTIDTSIWAFVNAGISQNDVLIVPALPTYPYVMSVSCDITESSVMVEFAQFANVGTGSTENIVEFQLDTQNTLGLGITNGAVYARLRTNGTANDVGWVPVGSNRFFRIRHTAGTVFWEMSPDGENWSNVGNPGQPTWDLTNGTILLQAGNWNSETNPGEAHFATLNGESGITPPETLAPSFQWKGITWQTRNWSGDPQYNGEWNDDMRSIWLDEQDRLHLAIKRIGGVLHGAEVKTDGGAVGYGYFTFVSATDPTTLPNTSVLGYFTYDDYVWNGGNPAVDSPREIDFEVATWNVASDPMQWHHTYHPMVGDERGVGQHSLTPQTRTAHVMKFEPGRIQWWTYDQDGQLIGYDETNQDVFDAGNNLAVHLNHWVNTFGGQTITPETPESEIVIAEMKYETLESREEDPTDEFDYYTLGPILPPPEPLAATRLILRRVV